MTYAHICIDIALMIACGRHVDNELLQTQNGVMIFLGKALPGLRDDVSPIWLYDNATLSSCCK